MLDRMLVRDLVHLRGQAIAAALVIACGVAAFVSMRSTYHSLLGAQTHYYTSCRFAEVFASFKRAPESIAVPIRNIPGVSAVQLRVVKDVTLSVPKLPEPATGRLISIPNNPQSMINQVFLRAGRYIDAARDDEVLASEAFVTANGLRIGDRVDAILNGRWKLLSIVGIALSPEYIYEVGAGQLLPDNRRFGVLWMGHRALSAAFDMEGAANDVVMIIEAGSDTQSVIARLDRLLERYGSTGAYDREEQLSHRFISDEIAQNRITSSYVPGIFFAVAMFLVHVVLSRLVTLQRAEIGLLKAVGYSDTAAGLHYVKFALAVASGGVILGSGLGLYLGAALTELYQDYYRFPDLRFEASWTVVGAAALLSLVTAVTGAVGAVRAALTLPPAEALRPPAPAGFRAGFLERLGLQRLLSTAARMIVRGVARRPWRAALSILGIGCSAGIIVVGGFFLDAIDHVMRVQFEVIQRETLAVLFNETRPNRGAFALARLPGVWRVEPFRLAPARLRVGHRSKRVQLTGLTSPSELHRLIDSEMQPVAVPPQGLVLTEKLAELLQTRPGGHVTAEILEGKRRQRQIPVAALVAEPTGIGAYMERSELARLLGEEEAMSGAYLSVDVRDEAELYAALKRMPTVSGVSIRAAMLARFKEIVDESVVISTLINLLFACVIAFGVVYNNSRVALSERGNELASLRVLGFTRREVSVILLGEQALLTVIAMPFGLSLGYLVCMLLSARLDTELYRIPLVVSAQTLLFAVAVITVAAALSGMAVARRLHAMDLIAVLKTRE
jgi:putative ABC transport system permease protein